MEEDIKNLLNMLENLPGKIGIDLPKLLDSKIKKELISDAEECLSQEFKKRINQILNDLDGMGDIYFEITLNVDGRIKK